MQAAIDKVEEWTNIWGFKLSNEKSQVICFAKRHVSVPMKLYGHVIEQVRGLGFCWMKRIPGVNILSKMINNMLRCLSG